MAATACGGGVFATFVTGDYLFLAFCLAHQLARVRSACPLVVVYDERTLSPEAGDELRRHFKASELFSLGGLFRRLDSSAPAFRSTLCTSE